ncbi:MAG: galactokinase [Bacteroidales bacterium]|nr:galactokinase [Bacteroidales bacterium]
MDIESLKQKFIKINGGDAEDIQVFFAPGRVNLIGEHTDYNGGYVLPYSLQYGTYLLVRTIKDPKVKFKSMNFPITAEVCQKLEILPIGSEWINYPLGVLREFHNRNLPVPGMQLLYAGDIPNGAGLSSSASIEVVTAYAINSLVQNKLTDLNIVQIAQQAENEFVGMQCGIMDQFAVTMGKRDHVIFLNCETLAYELVPLQLREYKIIISDTKIKRVLADSKYNERRSQCEEAVMILNKDIKIKNLSDLDIDAFKKLQDKITDPVIKKRAKHVIYENQRVLDSVKALKNGNFKKFGMLMYESHNLLKKDYEVSCGELDILVEEAKMVEGVLGSRMTGGGFGGCTVSIVQANQIETFKQNVGNNYTNQTGITPDFYIAEIGDGVKRIQ